MKKGLYLVLLVGLSWACQKREYPVFRHLPSGSYNQPNTSSTPTAEQSPQVATHMPAAAASPLAASTSNDVASIVLPTEPTYTASEEAVVTQIKGRNPQPTWQDKVIIKKTQKQVRKESSSTKAAAPKAKTDTVALLALIFGAGGLLLLLIGGGLGLLFGLAGLVLGIIGLGRAKRGVAPRSSRTMSILGIVFGGLVTLLALLLIVAIASSGFFFV